MKARDVMAQDVISVDPDMPVKEVARTLAAHGISAAPVVDTEGEPIGMISEGDLIGRDDAARKVRRDWWLTLLSEGEALHPDFLATIRAPGRRARDVMAAPVISVDEDADVAEIARLLTGYRIKRVPVLREGRIVGIVSRADLVRALAGEAQKLGAEQPEGGGGTGSLAEALAGFERHFLHHEPAPSRPAPKAQSEPADESPSAAVFRELIAEHERQQREERREAKHTAAEQRRHRVAELMDFHVSDKTWRALLHQARLAAEHGEKQYLLLRFPSRLCSDGGRAINAGEPDWPASLRGEAAEIYLRWERDLRPRGFHLVAHVLDFPGGLPGDIGLFLAWGA